MQVECPECRGARTKRYIDLVPMPEFTNRCMEATATDIAYSAHTEDCRTCKGVGRIKSTARVPVMRDGERIGTMRHDFDPANINSRNPLYRPRLGDFRRQGDVWIANPMLGNGDLEAVPGFVWDWERRH